LIELLVVIAVIGLLASVVIVNLTGTRSKARIARSLQFSQSVHNALGSEAVGVWNFDEGSGTIANDSSGYGNNGTVSGANYTTDTPSGQGYSLSFDGVDDYVDCGNHASLNITDAITISFWMNLANTDTFQTIVDKNWSNGYAVLIQKDRRILGYYLGGGGPNYYTVSTSVGSFNWNEWVHVAYIFTINTAKIYINNIEKASKVPEGNIVLNPTINLRIGRTLGNYYPANGLIDEVRIYERALETAQIETLYYASLDSLLARGLLDEQEYRERLARR